LYWYDGGHVGHVFSRRVQKVTKRFLRGVIEQRESLKSTERAVAAIDDMDAPEVFE
jgi:hypothetical protein